MARTSLTRGSTRFRLWGQKYFPEGMMPQLNPKSRSYHIEVAEKRVPKQRTCGKRECGEL